MTLGRSKDLAVQELIDGDQGRAETKSRARVALRMRSREWRAGTLEGRSRHLAQTGSSRRTLRAKVEGRRGVLASSSRTALVPRRCCLGSSVKRRRTARRFGAAYAECRLVDCRCTCQVYPHPSARCTGVIGVLEVRTHRS
jgi:hypothetical protein